MRPPPTPKRHLVAAFAAIYVVWGSTYLAIRFGVETIPPFILGGTRFLSAGLIMTLVARLRGARPATAREWRAAAISGACLIVGGNGLLSWAQASVPSGLAALLVATVPLWLVVVARVGPDREAATRRELLGLGLGLGGVAVLVGGSGAEVGIGDADGADVLRGAFLVLAASLSWAFGSIYGRRATLPSPQLHGTALTMVAGGGLLLLLALATGDFGRVSPAEVSTRSWASLAYLVVFGSIVAFSAYVWLLPRVRPAVIGTYAYVNPVVALLLGGWLADEPFTRPMLVGSGAILVAVVLVQRGRAAAARIGSGRATAAEAAPAAGAARPRKPGTSPSAPR